MSYNTYTYIDGYGFCVDDIHTTPERLLKLAAMNPTVLRDVRTYLAEKFHKGYDDEKLDMSDFYDLTGDCGEHGLAYVLYNVIDDFEVVYASDYDWTEYILYTPKYPWQMNEKELNLNQNDIKNIFNKYISVLTDEQIIIEYYELMSND